MRRRPSQSQIAAFTSAARAGSMSGAAAALGVSQSAVTQGVAKLEGLMGAPLFVRRRDGLELTGAGRDLFEAADRLRTLEDAVAEKVARYADLESGALRIVANAPRPALPAIARFAQAHPGVELEFTLVSWSLAVERLRARTVDAAFVTEPPDEPGMTARAFGGAGYRAYAPLGHPLGEVAGPVSLKTLAQWRMILPEDGSFTQRVVSAQAKALGIDPRRAIRTTTFPVVREAVLHGLGVGLWLEDALLEDPRLVSRPVLELPDRYVCRLVTPADAAALRLVARFIEIAMRAPPA